MEAWIYLLSFFVFLKFPVINKILTKNLPSEKAQHSSFKQKYLLEILRVCIKST